MTEHHPGASYRCARCGQSECWCEVGREPPHVQVARAAALFGKVAWIGLVLSLIAYGVWSGGKERAWWGFDAPKPVPIRTSHFGEPVRSTTVIHGGHTYTGPIYASDWVIDEKTGQLVKAPR